MLYSTFYITHYSIHFTQSTPTLHLHLTIVARNVCMNNAG